MLDRKVESFLYEWRYDWSCFWDESDVPLDPNKDCIFLALSPLLPSPLYYLPNSNIKKLFDDERYIQTPPRNVGVWICSFARTL
jgi:hypothetical protein